MHIFIYNYSILYLKLLIHVRIFRLSILDGLFYSYFSFEENDMNQNLLNVEELAQTLNVPKSWIYSRTREFGPNSMPKIKVGKYCRFILNDVLEWLKGQNEDN